MNYEIRRVSPTTYDIFSGNQWGTHSRIHRGRNNTHVTKGEKLPYSFLKHLHNVLAPNMPINYGQTHQQTLDNCFVHLQKH
jgi:hypothetical protein